MKDKSRLLTFLIMCASLISFSSCSIFNSGANDNFNSSSKTTISHTTTSFEPLESYDLVSYNVIDLEKYSLNSSNNYKDYVLNKPNQEFKLELKFNNPHRYPINSVTINNTTYDKNKITCLENNSKIIVTAKATADYGVQLYQIKNLNYGDDKNIFFINRKFVLRLNSSNGITISNFNYTPTSSSLNVSFDIKDIDNVSKTLPLNYAFMDKQDGYKEVDISSLGLKVGSNNFTIKNLKENHQYQLQIYYGRYLNYELGSDTFIDINKFDMTTSKAIELKNITADYQKVTFDIDNKDNVEIIKMYAKNQKTNVFDGLSNSSITEFKNIKSDTDYLLGVVFKFNDLEYTREYPFKTKAYAIPIVNIGKYDAKYNSISYEIEFDDPFNLAAIRSVQLIGINGSTLYEAKGTFKNLKINATYTFVLNYIFDLRNGDGVQNRQVVKNISTKTFDTSDISFSVALNGKNAIDYELNVGTRNDITLNKVELYLFDQLVQSKQGSELCGTFKDLINEKEYEVKASYTIALPNNEGDYLDVATKKIKTRALKTPEFNLKTTIGRKDIAYEIVKNDEDNVFRLFKVLLYKNDKFIESSLTSSGTFLNLMSGETYTIKINYKLEYNNNIFPDMETKEYKVTTDTFTPPEFILEKVDIGPDYFGANIKLNDPTQSLIPGSIYAVVNDNNIRHNNQSYLINDYRYINLQDLHSCTSHTLSIRYEYDLNDGTGKKTKWFTYNFSTLKQIVVTKFEILRNNYDNPELRSFDIHLIYKNPDQLYFDKVIINGVTLDITSPTTAKNAEIYLHVGDIFNYNPYAYSNTLDGFITGTGEQYGAYLKNKYSS